METKSAPKRNVGRTLDAIFIGLFGLLGGGVGLLAFCDLIGIGVGSVFGIVIMIAVIWLNSAAEINWPHAGRLVFAGYFAGYIVAIIFFRYLLPHLFY